MFNVFHFHSDFATATRNYAKRQMMWYRKDKLFLFLQIFRNEPVEGNPYEKVAQELLHWFNAEKSSFDQVLQKQLLMADYASDYIKKGNVHVDYDSKDIVEFRVLKWLLETHRIKLSGRNKDSNDDSYSIWLERNKKLHEEEEEDREVQQFSAFGKLIEIPLSFRCRLPKHQS